MCGARFEILSTRGRRVVEAADFFLGPLTTVLEPDEILIGVTFPAWPTSRRWGFEEFSLRQGDFAIAGVGALIDDANALPACRLVVFGVGEKAVRIAEAEQVIAEKGSGADAIAEAAATAAGAVEAQTDIHASAEYRRALVEVLVERTLRRAAGLGSAS